jgi:hypothetical protein
LVGVILLLALLVPLGGGARPAPQSWGRLGFSPWFVLPLPRVGGARLFVSRVASAPTDAHVGHTYVLHGRLVNEGNIATRGVVSVHLLRVGSRPLVAGRASLGLRAHDSGRFRVAIRLPRVLHGGSYAIVACVRRTERGGEPGCVTAERHLQVGRARHIPPLRLLSAVPTRTCSSGAHSLSPFGCARVPGDRKRRLHERPHRRVSNYDTESKLFLPGTRVVLTDRATQCLTDFSLDFERTSPNSKDGPDMAVRTVLVNGRPASFRFVQPTYPGDPNGQNDPDPRAHEASQVTPVGGPQNNPFPPACSPALMSTNPNKQDDLHGTQCPANKLVITPSSPIASGTRFVVEVDYTGRPGVHNDGDGTTEGWFRVAQPGDAGSFVTTEPVGSEDWMPLNNHPSSKPTHTFYDTVPAGKTAIANGELVSQQSTFPMPTFRPGRRHGTGTRRNGSRRTLWRTASAPTT